MIKNPLSLKGALLAWCLNAPFLDSHSKDFKDHPSLNCSTSQHIFLNMTYYIPMGR